MPNIWIGQGRLTDDPVLGYTRSGKAVTHLHLAVVRPDDTESVDVFDVAVFGALAENTTRCLAKGRWVLVEGTLRQTRPNRDSSERTAWLEIVGTEVSFLDTPRPTASTGEAQP